ncbi:hypothetical protein QR685DRAFT_49397 [Neurospora intermedia]|uniref:Uncharacterized protein n=1 Tax=Neurospora intermedia TaxID=5142 RepID=A0ABR3DRZ8_NEUIN
MLCQNLQHQSAKLILVFLALMVTDAANWPGAYRVLAYRQKHLNVRVENGDDHKEVPGSGIALQLVSCVWKIEVPENRVAGIAGVEKIELKRSTSGRSPEMKSLPQVTCR